MWRAPRESQGYLHPQLPSGRSRARRPLARCSGPLPLVRAYPAGTAPLARRRSHTPPSPPWASNLRAHGLAPAAAKLQAHPRRCPHLLLHLYPCLPPGHPRPRRPLAALVGLCPACTAQQAHCPRTPLPCRSGAPRPRAGSHAPAASALHTRVPADACTCIPPGRPRLRRPLARRARPVPLPSSRSLGCSPSTAPLARSLSHTPPFPRPGSLPALIDAPALSLGFPARITADASISLRTCTPACRPAHPLAERCRAGTVAFVRLCPSGTATLAQRPLAHPDFAAPRDPTSAPMDAPAVFGFTRAPRPTPVPASLHSARPRALADHSPPTRRAPNPPRPVVPRLHRPAARNPFAHPALAAPGRAGLSPEASVTKGRE